MPHEAVHSRSRIITTVAALVAVVALTGSQSSCEAQKQQHANSKNGSNAEANANANDNGNGNGNGSGSHVKYSVNSDAQIETITYLDEDGTLVTKSNVGRSWSGTGPEDHGTVLISATTGDGSSMIKCSVTVGGEVVQRASAVGGGNTTVVCKTSY